MKHTTNFNGLVGIISAVHFKTTLQKFAVGSNLVKLILIAILKKRFMYVEIKRKGSEISRKMNTFRQPSMAHHAEMV